MTLEELKAEALKLPSDEREWLADFLYASVDGEDSDLGEAWQAEIARRIDEVRSGAVRTIPAEQALAEIQAELADMGVNLY
jgi:putative addiction module component (TIGR02574 family)